VSAWSSDAPEADRWLRNSRLRVDPHDVASSLTRPGSQIVDVLRDELARGAARFHRPALAKAQKYLHGARVGGNRIACQPKHHATSDPTRRISVRCDHRVAMPCRPDGFYIGGGHECSSCAATETIQFYHVTVGHQRSVTTSVARKRSCIPSAPRCKSFLPTLRVGRVRCRQDHNDQMQIAKTTQT